MTEDHEVSAPEAADPAAVIADLQRQLSQAVHEREELRHVANEKAQLLQRIDALTQERDRFARDLATAVREREEFRSAANAKAELLHRIDSLTQERDALAQAHREKHIEREGLLAERQQATVELDATRAQRDHAQAERDRLKGDLATLRAQIAAEDPFEQLWTAISRLAAQGVAWVRGKIPEGHPALPWYDWTVSTVQEIGCFAVRGLRDLAVWAAPQVTALGKKLMTEVETRLAKK